MQDQHLHKSPAKDVYGHCRGEWSTLGPSITTIRLCLPPNILATVVDYKKLKISAFKSVHCNSVFAPSFLEIVGLSVSFLVLKVFVVLSPFPFISHAFTTYIYACLFSHFLHWNKDGKSQTVLFPSSIISCSILLHNKLWLEQLD